MQWETVIGLEVHAQLATQSKILEKAPDAGAVRKDLAQKALDGLKDVDTTGEKFEKQKVEVTAGGE